MDQLKFWIWNSGITFPETNSMCRRMKMDGWNTIVSFWGPAFFQERAVSFSFCSTFPSQNSCLFGYRKR